MKDVTVVDDFILTENKPVLVISKVILGKMIDAVQSNKIEIGGILIGYKLMDIDEYRITDVTFPYKDDYGSIAYFERKDIKHNIVLNDLHDKDISKTYLGDWHSHPESSSSPSNLDLSTYRNHTKNSQTSSNHLFYLIIGKNIDIQVYSYRTKKLIKSIKYNY
jgi:integrative and conjugative element protein (TIGR02256 family)